MAVGRGGGPTDDFIKSAHPNIMTGVSVELDENMAIANRSGRVGGSKYSKRGAVDDDGQGSEQIEFAT